MTDYPKPRSGGSLTIWQDVDIVCLCGNRVGAYGSQDDSDIEIVTCEDCGQQFKVTCKVEDVDGFVNQEVDV